MESTLAEHIEERAKEWTKSFQNEGLQCLTDGGKDLLKQAQRLLQADETVNKKLQLGKSKISEKGKLAPHLGLNIVFNQFLAEILLKEGSLLLDRCLQQRKEYQELKTKFFEACVQVQELVELNIITREEEKTYSDSVKILEFELTALQNEQAGVKESIEILSNRNNSLLKISGNSTILAIETTKISEKAMFSAEALLQNSNLDRKEKDGIYNKIPMAGAGTKKSIVNFSREFARDTELLRGRKELNALEIQLAQLRGTFESLNEKINSATIQLGLKKKQLDLQIKRNDVARFVALRRAEQLALPDGALNYREQMESVRERLKNDLDAAWLRLSKVAEGFEMLYEYPIDEIFSKYSPENGFNFDALVTWCQKTNTWLASFLDTQQQVTCSFSLRQLIAEQGGNFDDGLDKGKWQFKLKEEHFYSSKFVRLRSFAIQIDSGHSRGSWNIAITPPKKAKLRNGKEVKNLEQNVGRLYLGRVNETMYQVIPESAAPPKLYNASPISQDVEGGEWTIEVMGLRTEILPSSAILDIDIHLTVALV